MIISEVARESGVSPKTIRYYEQVGLIGPAQRGANGYRLYDQRAVEVLRFVKRARDLGFTVEEVGELLALWNDPDRAAAEVKAVAARHLERIEAKLRELEALRRTVDDLVHRCHGSDRPDCPILDDLTGLGEAS